MTQLFGGIEAGGTKFVCAVGTGPDDIRAEQLGRDSWQGKALGFTLADLPYAPPDRSALQ